MLGLGLGLTSVLMGGGSAWSPTSLFKDGEQGLLMDPSDLATLFQDTEGTTPVTAAGQSVGLVLDKSGRGNHATQSTAASRPTYQVDSGGRGYLSFDGVDDFLVTPTITPGTDKAQVFVAFHKTRDSSMVIVETGDNFSAGGFAFYNNGDARLSAAMNNGSGFANFKTAPHLSPATKVMAAGFDKSGSTRETETLYARVDGVDERLVTEGGYADGSGVFPPKPIHIGRRGGVTLPLNGRIYGLIARFGPNLTADQISQTERWMAQLAGVTI